MARDEHWIDRLMVAAEQQGKDVLETIKTLLQAEWAGQEVTLLTDLA